MTAAQINMNSLGFTNKRNALQYARLNTLACWWPSKMSGRKSPNYRAIVAELLCAAENEPDWGTRRALLNCARAIEYVATNDTVKP